MKRLSLLTIILAFIAICNPLQLNAQDEIKKKVAVYVLADESYVRDSYKKVVGSQLVQAFSNSSSYVAVERTDDFIRVLNKLDSYSQEYVRNDQIASLGQQFGVKYVLVVELMDLGDIYYLDGRIINVESSMIDKSASSSGPVDSPVHIIKLAEQLATKLLEEPLKDTPRDMSGSSQQNSTPNNLPEWYDKDTMKAIPLGDDEVLIVYKKLKTSNVWDPSLDKELKIYGIDGTWDISVTQKLFNAIANSGLYIPSEGLYAGRHGCSIDFSRQLEFSRGGVMYKTVTVPNLKESYKFSLISSKGEREYDGGEYTEKGELVGTDVKIEKSDTRNYQNFSFYPFRTLIKENGIWTIKKYKTNTTLEGTRTIINEYNR